LCRDPFFGLSRAVSDRRHARRFPGALDYASTLYPARLGVLRTIDDQNGAPFERIRVGRPMLGCPKEAYDVVNPMFGSCANDL